MIMIVGHSLDIIQSYSFILFKIVRIIEIINIIRIIKIIKIIKLSLHENWGFLVHIIESNRIVIYVVRGWLPSQRIIPNDIHCDINNNNDNNNDKNNNNNNNNNNGINNKSEIKI